MQVLYNPIKTQSHFPCIGTRTVSWHYHQVQPYRRNPLIAKQSTVRRLSVGALQRQWSRFTLAVAAQWLACYARNAESKPAILRAVA